MERLTKAMSCPEGTKIYDISNELFELNASRADKTRMILQKLAEYEDLEEQNRLIKLSCTTKDTVWHFCRELGQILEYKVYEITILFNVVRYRCIAYSAGFPKDDLDDITVRTSDFGKSVFLTKSEAEARLKEPNYVEEVLSQCPSSDFKFVGGTCPKCGEYVTSSDDFKKCHYCGKLLK